MAGNVFTRSEGAGPRVSPLAGTRPARFTARLGFQRRSQIQGLLLFLPVLIWILAVVIYPIVVSVILSFQDARLSAVNARWVGFANYARILERDPEFWTAAKNTVVWTVANYVVQMGAGLLIALLLNRCFPGVKSLRTWIVVPWVIPTVAMAIMWVWMLNASVGVVNHLLLSLGAIAQRVAFLGDPVLAMPTVVILNSWRWIPLVTIVLLAAMQTVPNELYEAALVDGASAWARFRHVTLGWIRPTLHVLSLLVLIWIFNSFVVVWLTTQGGPGNETLILPVLVYKRAFAVFRLGEAAAISVLMSVVALAVAMLYLRSQRLEETS
jgi:multiple sugar transport system permease protein